MSFLEGSRVISCLSSESTSSSSDGVGGSQQSSHPPYQNIGVEELIIECLLNPLHQSRNRDQQNAMYAHEIAKQISIQFPTHPVNALSSAEVWLPVVLHKMVAERKIANCNAELPNTKAVYHLTEAYLKHLVAIQYLKLLPKYSNPTAAAAAGSSSSSSNSGFLFSAKSSSSSSKNFKRQPLYATKTLRNSASARKQLFRNSSSSMNPSSSERASVKEVSIQRRKRKGDAKRQQRQQRKRPKSSKNVNSALGLAAAAAAEEGSRSNATGGGRMERRLASEKGRKTRRAVAVSARRNLT